MPGRDVELGGEINSQIQNWLLEEVSRSLTEDSYVSAERNLCVFTYMRMSRGEKRGRKVVLEEEK
jgi:hypothetical protein